jgi:hypothetical protein
MLSGKGCAAALDAAVTPATPLAVARAATVNAAAAIKPNHKDLGRATAAPPFYRLRRS